MDYPELSRAVVKWLHGNKLCKKLLYFTHHHIKQEFRNNITSSKIYNIMHLINNVCFSSISNKVIYCVVNTKTGRDTKTDVAVKTVASPLCYHYFISQFRHQ